MGLQHELQCPSNGSLQGIHHRFLAPNDSGRYQGHRCVQFQSQQDKLYQVHTAEQQSQQMYSLGMHTQVDRF
jgi:hypothetical protein